MDWHLITCEYPPQSGGISDYSQLIAAGLAAEGETVHVWCPSSAPTGISSGAVPLEGSLQTGIRGVVVHRELGQISSAELRLVGKMLDDFPAPRRSLVQWVPHGYGYKSMNLPFCLWLWKRAKLNHDQIEIMVHEPFLAFGEGSGKRNLVAFVHRIMMILLLTAARRVWVSIPLWETCLRPFALGREKAFGLLPVPSNIPVVDDPGGVLTLRTRYAPLEEFLVGHFGAYDHYMTKLMLELVPSLLTQHDRLSIVLLGKGSLELRNLLIDRHPDLAQQVHATGALSSEDVSRHISACHVMLQPYEDGVSGRRGSVMAALAHGVAVVTTIGKATERCWAESQAVKLAKVGDITGMVEAVKSLLADAAERSRLSIAGRALYDERFDIKRTITRMREAAA
jgi:glycosyltransferase involved in cell wall biosynthesis